MRRSTRSLLLLIASLPFAVLLASSLYRLGMHTLEGESRDFWSAIEFAAETITTTGYGGDASWDHPLMVLFVVSLQFMGVIFIYMVVPIVLVPFLEERFEGRLPLKTKTTSDHVLLFRFSPSVETVIEELLRSKIPLVLVENDESMARQLVEEKVPVVFRRVFEDSLHEVGLANARTLILNGVDEENAALAVMARQRGYEGRILAFVEEPLHRQLMTLAGVDRVFTPRIVIGTALAARASQEISPRVDGAQILGDRVEVRELRVEDDSMLAGKTLAESDIGSRTGAIIIGIWVRGVLQPLPSADHVMQERDILIAIGETESLDRLYDLVCGCDPLPTDLPFLVIGYGEVGQQVVRTLREGDETVVVSDLKALNGVDVVGDALDPNTLDALDLTSKRGVIMALDDDKATLFATIIVKAQAPRVPIIVRVNRTENIEPIFRAGADFALSIAQISGRMLAQELLHKETFSFDPKLHVDRLQAPKLSGTRLRRGDIRRRTGCSIVAIERPDSILVNFPDELILQDDDMLFVCGTADANEDFRRRYA